jgi:cell division protein FtsQ
MTERARIRRGTAPRHKRPAITRRGAAAASATRKVVASRALATIPLPVERIKAFARRLALAGAGVAIVALLWVAHVPQFIGIQIGELAGIAGFSVKHVETQGIHHMDRLQIASVALDQDSTAMPLVDLEGIRQKLLKFGWVSDARVSRRLPDTLLVDIVERQPAAIWQSGGKLALIDKDGVVLSPVDPQAMPDLPLLIGPGANTHAQPLAALMAAAPRLKPMIAGATWIGDRRWDVRFSSGETLALPEGGAASATALAKFDRMDQATRLLGVGFVHFDMRLPGKFVVRVSREPGHEVGDPQAALPPSIPAPAGTDAI